MKDFLKFIILLVVSILSFAVEKSPLDLRTFDLYELENGMKVLFIVDPNVKTSAAAMRIEIWQRGSH